MNLNNKNIIIYVEDNYEDLELWYPLLRMQEAGAKTIVVGPKSDQIYHSKHGYAVKSESNASDINPDHISGLIIPGGYAPDRMRVNKEMINLLRSSFEKNKVVAAICHAGWMLVSAGIIKEKQVTCYHTIKDDIINAGGYYLDEAVVKDGNIITSRQPTDLPQFCRAIIESLCE